MARPREDLALGLDVGGTKVELALVTANGRLVARRRQPTDSAGGPERVVEALVRVARELLAEAASPVKSVGVGLAGQVEAHSGVVRFTPNLVGWRDFPLAENLRKALYLPTLVTNDVNAAAYAEHALGAGRGVGSLAVFYIGTGVGGCIIEDGRLLEGADGYAGEFGHMTLSLDGRPCRCGNRGCIAAYVAGWAIAERAREAVAAAPEAGRFLVEKAGGQDRITAATVDEAAEAGDPFARRLVEETGRYLGAGLVSVVHAWNPRRLILGGGVIGGMPDLVAAAVAEMRTRTMPFYLENLEIAHPALGPEAGVVGAGLLAHRRFGEEGA